MSSYTGPLPQKKRRKGKREAKRGKVGEREGEAMRDKKGWKKANSCKARKKEERLRNEILD